MKYRYPIFHVCGHRGAVWADRPPGAEELRRLRSWPCVLCRLKDKPVRRRKKRSEHDDSRGDLFGRS